MEHWVPYFGRPEQVNADEEGPWMSRDAANFFGAEGVSLELLPGAACGLLLLDYVPLGRSVGVVDIDVHDDQGKLCAIGRGTYSPNVG